MFEFVPLSGCVCLYLRLCLCPCLCLCLCLCVCVCACVCVSLMFVTVPRVTACLGVDVGVHVESCSS